MRIVLRGGSDQHARVRGGSLFAFAQVGSGPAYPQSCPALLYWWFHLAFASWGKLL